jgi:hypothetical protein
VLAAIAAERRIGEDRGARYGGGGPLTPEP